MTTPFEVQVLDWEAARPLAHPVREAVFVVEQGVPPALEIDELDPVCDHAVVLSDRGRAVATGRLIPDGRIGRMAVLREWRGRGVGAAVLARLVERARERGMTTVALSAQTHAAPFYARFGFIARGEQYIEAGIPHLKMARDLAPAPPARGAASQSLSLPPDRSA
jgi:predicted GNAT family N-acyltransferase